MECVLAHVGGNWNNGANAGLTYWNLNNTSRIRRRCRKINKKSTLNYADASAVISYWGWLKRSDSYNFYHDTIKRLVDIKKAKRTVSNYAKQANSLRRAA